MSGWAGSTRRSTLPADWPRRRARILKRDGYQCTWHTQGRRCQATATQVDHIRRGQDHSEQNLRSLCADHHNAKSSREGNQARTQRTALKHRPPEPHPGQTPTRA